MENRISAAPELQLSDGRKKVAIVGFTPSRKQAPFHDESFEIWGLNGLFTYDDVTRCTRWFDLHKREDIAEERIEWYREAPVPIYLQEEWDDIPGSVRFPKEEIEEELGSTYFTNSISWMIAFAIWLGAEVIHVYGVDMAQATEYRHQRPNVEFWIGKAEGLGVETYVARTSDLLKATHQYGYGSDSGFRAKCKEKLGHHERKKAEITAEIRRLEQARATFEGARQAMEWAIQQWGVVDGESFAPDHEKPSKDGDGAQVVTRAASQPRISPQPAAITAGDEGAHTD